MTKEQIKDQWIKASEKSPTEEGEYLAWLERPLKYGDRVCFSTWYKGKWVGINGSVWPGMPKPKYWQPLPGDPEGEEK